MTARRTLRPITSSGYKDCWADRKLIADPPVDPNSAAKVANFVKDVNSWMGMAVNSYGSGKQFSSAMVETNDGDPVWTVTAYNVNKGVDSGRAPTWLTKDAEAHIASTPTDDGTWYAVNPANPVTYKGNIVASLHFPAELARIIADGTDAPLQCRNVDSGEEFHSWITKVDTANRHVTVGWGAYYPDYRKENGRFVQPLKLSDGSMNGRHAMGVSASGMPQSLVTPSIEEYVNGINHVIGMAVPHLLQRQEDDPENPGYKRVKPCYPAAGTDGRVLESATDAENYLEMGQILTLKRGVDYSKKHWAPWFRKFIQTVHDWGLMPTDTNGGGSVSIAGISPNQYDEFLLGGDNPYYTRLLGDASDQGNWDASWFSGDARDENGNKYDGFPYEDLIALPVCRNADDFAKITQLDEVDSWDAVDATIDELNEIRREMFASIDNLRGVTTSLKKSAASSTSTTGTTTAATPATETSSGSGLYTA